MTTSNTQAEREALWKAIEQAGSREAWVQRELEARGLLVTRRVGAELSEAELGRYKRELQREAAERRTLQREAWAAYRATHVVHLGEGVFWNDAADADQFDLPEPEARASDNELPRLDQPADLARALGMSVPDLRWLAYHREAATSVHYRAFTIPKRDGTPRTIWAPMPRLKAAQRWILRHVVERLPVHGAVHGFLAGRSVVSNAAPHCGADLVVNLDLSDFFPTVTWRRVRGVFRKGGYREQVATLLALLCTEAPREVVEHEGKLHYIALGPRCLPQGAPTSPALTNTLCQRMDRRLSGLARALGFRYTRYADDLTFSRLPVEGPVRVGALLGSVRHIVADEGFVVHPDKTRILRPGERQEVTGMVVNGPEGPRVPRPVKRRLRAALHRLRQGLALPEGESLETLVGLAAHIHQAEPALGRALLEELGSFVHPTR
jgi:RNA-directed DNA polymerase